MGYLDSLSPELRAWNKLPYDQQLITPKPVTTQPSNTPVPAKIDYNSPEMQAYSVGVPYTVPTNTGSNTGVGTGVNTNINTGQPNSGLMTQADIDARVKAGIQEGLANVPKTPSYDEMFKQLQSLINPPKKDAPAYVPQYGAETAKALSQYQNAINTPFKYNPSADAGLQAAQEQGIDTVNRQFARRNMLGSMSNEAQAKLLATSLIPQYQQQAQNMYQDNIRNLANQLSTYSGLENQGYNRYRDIVGDVNTENTNAYNKAKDIYDFTKDQMTTQQKSKEAEIKAIDEYYKEVKGMKKNPVTGEYEKTLDAITKESETADKVRKNLEESEKNTYGIVLSDKARQAKLSYDTLQNDEGFQNDLKQYGGNLALLRDMYLNQDPPDMEAANAVEGARLIKILNDPALLETYGTTEFGLVDSKIKERATDLRIKKIQEIRESLKAEMDNIDYTNYDAMSRMKFEKAKTDLENDKLDNYIKSINATFIEEEKKQDLTNKAMMAKNIQDQINTRAKTTAISQGHLDLAKEKEKSTKIDEIALAESLLSIQKNPIEMQKVFEDEEEKKDIIAKYGEVYYAKLIDGLRKELSKIKDSE